MGSSMHMTKPPPIHQPCIMEYEIREFKRCLHMFRSSVVVVVAVLLASLLLVLDGDPPAFPLPEGEEAVDCFNMKNARIWGNQSRIKVAVELKDFIQYPKEAAPSLLSVVVKNGNLTFKFRPERFWDVEGDLHDLSFCTLHTVAGNNINASLYCQGNLLATNTVSIKEIHAYPVGWSRILTHQHALADFRDICFNGNKSLVFMCQPSSQFDKFVPALNVTVPVTVTDKSYATFKNGVSPGSENTAAIFVAGAHESSVDVFTNVVIPVMSALSLPALANSPVVLVNPDTQKNLIPSIKPFITNAVMQSYQNTCYKTAIFINSPGGAFPGDIPDTGDKALAAHLRFAFSEAPGLAAQLRRRYLQQAPTKKLILLDSHLTHLAEQLRSKISNAEIGVLSDTESIPELAKRIASAKVYVSGHTPSKLFALFLPTGAKFIELVSDTHNCATFGKHLADTIGVAHLSLSISECECRSPDFRLKQSSSHFNPKEFAELTNLLQRAI